MKGRRARGWEGGLDGDEQLLRGVQEEPEPMVVRAHCALAGSWLSVRGYQKNVT